MEETNNEESAMSKENERLEGLPLSLSMCPCEATKVSLRAYPCEGTKVLARKWIIKVKLSLLTRCDLNEVGSILPSHLSCATHPKEVK
jgi:hypothetical protein